MADRCEANAQLQQLHVRRTRIVVKLALNIFINMYVNKNDCTTVQQMLIK